MNERKMSISESILLGSMTNKQAKFLRHFDDGSSCVLGAIEDATGLVAERAFPEMEQIKVANPVTRAVSQLNCTMASLNNGFCHVSGKKFESWSREKIAEWVAGIEAAQAVAGENNEHIGEQQQHDESERSISAVCVTQR